MGLVIISCFFVQQMFFPKTSVIYLRAFIADVVHLSCLEWEEDISSPIAVHLKGDKETSGM